MDRRSARFLRRLAPGVVALALCGVAPARAQTVDAIDWVAISTKLPDRQGKMCTGFKKTGETGPGESLPLVMHDQKMTVYDVRTCKEIASKDFKAPESCPVITFSKEASSYPSKDDMKAWLRTLRTKK